MSFISLIIFPLLLFCHSKLDIDYLYMAYADIMAKVRPLCLMVNIYHKLVIYFIYLKYCYFTVTCNSSPFPLSPFLFDLRNCNCF